MKNSITRIVVISAFMVLCSHISRAQGGEDGKKPVKQTQQQTQAQLAREALARRNQQAQNNNNNGQQRQQSQQSPVSQVQLGQQVPQPQRRQVAQPSAQNPLSTTNQSRSLQGQPGSNVTSSSSTTSQYDRRAGNGPLSGNLNSNTGTPGKSLGQNHHKLPKNGNNVFTPNEMQNLLQQGQKRQLTTNNGGNQNVTPGQLTSDAQRNAANSTSSPKNNTTSTIKNRVWSQNEIKNALEQRTPSSKNQYGQAPPPKKRGVYGGFPQSNSNSNTAINSSTTITTSKASNQYGQGPPVRNDVYGSFNAHGATPQSASSSSNSKNNRPTITKKKAVKKELSENAKKEQAKNRGRKETKSSSGSRSSSKSRSRSPKRRKS